MVEETLRKIEAAIKGARDSGPADKDELIRLLEQLKAELRAQKRSDLLGTIENQLAERAAGLEAEHPQTAKLVNEVCSLLASIGI